VRHCRRDHRVAQVGGAAAVLTGDDDRTQGRQVRQVGADPLEALLVGEDHDAGRVRQAELELVGRPPSVEGDDNGAARIAPQKAITHSEGCASQWPPDHPSRRRTRPGGGGRWSRRSGSAPEGGPLVLVDQKVAVTAARDRSRTTRSEAGAFFPGSQRHAVDLDVFHLEHLPRPGEGGGGLPMDMVVASSLILGRPLSVGQRRGRLAGSEDCTSVVGQLGHALFDVVHGPVVGRLGGAAARASGYHRRHSSFMVDTSTER